MRTLIRSLAWPLARPLARHLSGGVWLAMLAAALTLAASGAQAADIVVIVNPAAARLTKEDVEDVFLGRVPRAIPVDQPLSQSIRTEFYSKATGRNLAQVKTVWSRVIFTGKGLTPKEYPDAATVKQVVANNPRAVGYIERSQVDSTVKIAFELD